MNIVTWHDLETEIQKELVRAQRMNPLAWHRFYDSRSAQSMIPAQPADFLVTSAGVTVLIEAKHSTAHLSLINCFANNVGAHQSASARIWTRAGAGYIFLFHSSLADQTEIWDGVYCSERRKHGKRLENGKQRVYASPAEALQVELNYE